MANIAFIIGNGFDVDLENHGDRQFDL